MRCPYCHVNNDKVIDSREIDSGAMIRRRRECKDCGKRFTTYEHVESTQRLTVIKKDNTRMPYDRQKVLAGLQKACYKRPVSAEAVARAVDEIDEELFGRGVREVEATEIGKLVMEKLKRMDHVAYVRFASVYMQITNIDDLLDEVQTFRETTSEPPPRDQGALF